MKWCSNSLGFGNHLPLKISALMVALLMIASCIVLVLDEADAAEPAETVETTQERSAPPLGRIGFEPIILPPFVPRPFLSLVMNEVRSTDELSYMIVFVNSTIYNSIDEELETYADDVERTGIGVKIITVNDADPEQIRNVIIDSINDLEGCFLVGDLPTAWFEMTEDWGNGPEYTQFPCDLFYMDRNGVWTDSDNDGMYDVHSGDIQPEIWVGRYRTDNMQGDEISLLKEYFAKNHAYRTGELTFPNKALTYIDDDWQPGTDVSDAVGDAFSDNTVVYDRATTKRSNYLAYLEQLEYNTVHVMCHGNPGGQGFKVPDPNDSTKSIGEPNGGISGVDDIADIDDRVLFYNLFVCSSARFTSDDYLAGWYVQSGDTLVAIGSTKTGSMINDADFYHWAAQYSVGIAFNNWFASTLDGSDQSMRWIMGMDIIGDPTICLTGNHDVWIDTIGLPSVDMEDVVYIYWPDGTIHYGDLVNGDHFIGIVKHGSRIVVQPLFIGVGYVPLDPIEFIVVDPIRTEINYQKQCQVRIQSHGLDIAQAHTVVTYTSLGTQKTFELWDGDDFFEYCDAGTEVVVDDEVVMVPDGERYKSIDQDTWTVDDIIDAHIHFYHQYNVKVDISTIGPDKLHAGNYVECSYWQWGDEVEVHLYDDKDLNTWVDQGSALFIAVESQESIPNVRWRAIDGVQQTVDGPIDWVRAYFQQYWIQILTKGLDDEEYPSTVSYFTFILYETGTVWDDETWQGWCNVGTKVSWSLFVYGLPGERYHAQPPCEEVVTVPHLIIVVYHPEYLVTIGVEGLPEGVSTEVTVGVANVHDVDWPDFILTLYSGNANAWTGWVHPVTDMTALGAVNSGTDEKYVLFCWTGNDVVFSPPTMWAIEPNWYYKAHYIGLKKEMNKEQATLTEPVMVHLKVSLTSAVDGGDSVILIDDLPNEFSFVVGSAKDNGVVTSPTLDSVMVAPFHQRLTFALGPGNHDIWFEVRINRAYGTDRSVTNSASATIDLKELDPLTLAVQDKLTIKPYVGPTFKVYKTGPDTVKWRTNVSWELTFIVKDSYSYKLGSAYVKDCFGPEIKYIPSSVMANLVTKPSFTISGYMTKQVGMNWNLGNVAPGEAFMLQVTVHTTDKGLYGGQGFTSLGDNPIDFGSSLRYIGCNYYQVTLTALPIWVKAIKPL